MTLEEQLAVIEQRLLSPGKLTILELRNLLKQRDDLTRIKYSSEIAGPSGLDDNSMKEKRSLHELLMFQKELNYLKRQVSKEIRVLVRSQQAESRQSKVLSD